MGAAESTGRPNGTIEREEEEQRRRRQLESGGSFTEKAATAATLAAGVAVAAWGISRILSDNTNSDEENDDTAIKSTNPSIRESIRGDRFISTVTDRGYHYTKGQSSGYNGGVFGQDDGGSSDVSKQLSTWSPPPRGQFIMNTAGACKPHPSGLGGYGGILRNDRGDFVCCFYGFIGLTDSLTAELRGILEGLKILERRRLMGSILATDCQAAYQFVTRQKGKPINNKITAECRDMITECVLLIGDNNIIVKKIEGKRNKCADKLANMAITEQDDMEYHDVIPREIKSLIDEDKRQLESGGSLNTEKAATAATLAAGAAWGISRILSDNTNSDEENDDTAIKSTNPSIRESIRGDRVISTVTDRGYHSTKGQSSGYCEGIISQHDGGSDVAKLVWPPPPRGRFKMNTDGSCKPNQGPSGGYGGILRNHHGDFVYGFCGFIDRSTDGLTAEFIGIHKGLKLLIKLGYICMGTILETDCQPAEQWINSKDKHKPGKSAIISACWDIIDECRKLKDEFEIDIIHIGENANKCAHKLAAMGAKEKKDYVEFEVVPYDIKNLVDEDKRLMGC